MLSFLLLLAPVQVNSHFLMMAAVRSRCGGRSTSIILSNVSSLRISLYAQRERGTEARAIASKTVKYSLSELTR